MKEKIDFNKKKIVGVALSLVILSVLLIFLIYTDFKNNDINYIEITQLHDNTEKQMMGYFVKTKNGKIIIVDGGNPGDSNNLKKYIDENGGKVDFWFLTHFHSDHVGALADIIENSDIKIDNIVYNFCTRNMVESYELGRLYQYDLIDNALKNDRIKKSLHIAKKGEKFTIDNVNVKILSVYENDITENFGNNTSMVFKLYINDKSILFLGDTGVESSEKLLRNNYNDLKSDYVQMSHHGQNGATFELYKAIDPEYCFWPTPEWLWNNDSGEGYNSGEWKTLETRECMKMLNVKQSYIEKDGDITLKIY